MNKYKIILFDLGKVVFDLSFDQVFEHWARSSNTDSTAIREGFEFDSLFNDFECGLVSEPEFRKQVLQQLKLDLSEKDFDEGWCNLYMDVYPGLMDLLQKLKNNYTLIALTNTNIIHERVWRRKYESVLKLFDKIYCSHQLGTRKPEIMIYQRVLDELSVSSSEVLFLDDNPDNTKAASALGIESILVRSPEQMMDELEQRLQK